ncbi:MAG: hypothetical protein AAB579_00335 [Patescibacteria group bacterium]
MPSVAGQLSDARNRARVSPSFREGGESLVAPPTGMMRTSAPEEEPEEGAGYEPSGPVSRGGTGMSGAGTSVTGAPPRDTMAGPAGAQGMAGGAELGAQLNPLKKVKVVGKVMRSLIPDQWLSWFSFDSWKDPVEIGLRLSILKIVFWVVLLGLVIIVAMATIEALDPTGLLL